jgi:glycogen debranching enzyme
MAFTSLGATLTDSGCDFAIWSKHASRMNLCLFDASGKKEISRLPMVRGSDDIHRVSVEGVRRGTRYGFRAEGVYSPDHGLWYDAAKLLVDPYAKELDRPFTYSKRLSEFGYDTANLVPKAIVTAPETAEIKAPLFRPGGFIYEVAVKPFTKLHPDIPEKKRGTIGALAHPSLVDHLLKLGVDAVELMPITAWIDERHLPPLGLKNGWGYNPVTFMALDPRLAPGGVAELRQTVATLRDAGIGVILDLVFNHTGESDRHGPTLSLRGVDNLCSFFHAPDNPGLLVNDTGCGNTVACDAPVIRQMIVDSLRHFVLATGVDGFRFDLAPILGRDLQVGFSRDAETLKAIQTDDVLSDRILIAEPWDIGPGGYQLGNFPEKFLEWNDRARDDMRLYWRGDRSMTGAMATALAGSSPIFSRHGGRRTRSVNFLAAHDGFTLMDLVSYERKHNEANGEENRDGHNDNHSWNNGAEGDTANRTILKNRRDDVMAMLSTLFASRGTVMLTAGDEGGRSQQGNNNAYAQDNEITWLDWEAMDERLVDHVAFVSAIRKRFAALRETTFFSGDDGDIEWLNCHGQSMSVADWETPDLDGFVMLLRTPDIKAAMTDTRLAVLVNRGREPMEFTLPDRDGTRWMQVFARGDRPARTPVVLARRTVAFYTEQEL